jgi:AraC-like DNA-binding protein
MRPTLGGPPPGGLERSGGDVLRYGVPAPGLERAEAALASVGFAPHRHDRYALGLTTGGVQAFRYRGARRICLPGQLHLLHPDEVHDGVPCTDAGFSYRIVYVQPELVAEAEGRLPFVADPVQDAGGAAAPLARALADLLTELDVPLDPLAAVSATVVLADALAALAGGPARRSSGVDVLAVRRARDHLLAHLSATTTAAELEHVTGLDRYTLVRQFRAVHGTTPDRFRLMRRLDLARAAIASGRSLADAAVEAGFADQSHLTRQFRRAFGRTPGRWRSSLIAS